jgi:hypothetical protein
MARAGTALVWSPRSNVRLYGETASIGVAKRVGVLVALGTDWILSGSMNMLREIACADQLNRGYFGGALSDGDLWRMVTINAAKAAAMDDVIGALVPGRFADLVIFEGRAARSPLRAVLDARVENIALVLRAGTPLYGDAALMAALGADARTAPIIVGIDAAVADAATPDAARPDAGSPDAAPATGDASVGDGAPSDGPRRDGGPRDAAPPAELCDTLDVCGVAKVVCVGRETGRSLDQLRAAVGPAAYPLFFCGEPAGEPTCVPRRPQSVEGSSVYVGQSILGDRDGDGVPDAVDNCPTVWNPIRPVDRGKQADADGDGLGDPCDPCPLEPGPMGCPASR